MKRVEPSGLRFVFILWIAFGLSCSWGVRAPESMAAGDWVENCWNEISHPTWEMAEKFLNPPTEFLTHSFIWDLLNGDQPPRSDQGALFDAYQLVSWKPLFVDGNFELNQRGRVLLHRLESLESDAIDPAPFNLKQANELLGKLAEIKSSMKDLEPSYRRIIEAAFPQGAQPGRSFASASEFLAYCRQNSGESATAGAHSEATAAFVGLLEQKYKGLFDAASRLDVRMTSNLVRFCAEMNPNDKERHLQLVMGGIDMAGLLKALEPTSREYAVVRNAYNYYKGSTHAASHAAPLGKEMESNDFLKSQSKAWNGMPNSQKVGWLGQSLKLMRQSATRQYDRYVRINAPEFLLEYHKDGKILATHRVIIGKSGGKRVKLNGQVVGENHTPTLSSMIERLIFNPRWYITDRILKELGDAVANDPKYVQSSLRSPSGQPRVFQVPGPKNPLGRIKFEFDNPYAVFIHDTPNKGLFQRARRDFSHGCVRVDKAVDLARVILAEDNNPAAAKVDSYLKHYNQVFVTLNEPVPIVIEYNPISVDEKGHIIFLGDVYGQYAGTIK